MRLYRLLAIVMYLMNRNKVTAKKLADYFEVSARTIYRDLETINQAGIPIIAYQGAQGGYGIIDNYKIDKQLLSSDEMSSILVALQGLDRTLDNREFKDIIEKFKVLIPDLKDEKTDKDKKYFIDFNPWGVNNRQKKKIDLLEEAIDTNKLIAFSYTNLKGIDSRREVEAMTLVLRGNSWYLYGYCRLRDDYRIFKINRIKELRLLDKRFIRKKEEFEASLFRENGQSNRELINLIMRFKEKVRPRVEEFFSEEDITVEDNGSLLVEVSYREDDWLYGFILSFANQVEIVEPVHLREIIKERAKKIYNLY